MRAAMTAEDAEFIAKVWFENFDISWDAHPGSLVAETKEARLIGMHALHEKAAYIEKNFHEIWKKAMNRQDRIHRNCVYPPES